MPFSAFQKKRPRTQRPSVNHYQPGVARTAICPHCFHEFPVGRVLFTSFDEWEPRTTRYSWLHRLFRRPFLPPRNKDGRPLTRRLCPKSEQHDPHYLPFTAGAQPSLVIGMVGARHSGKSHYIASLIERLKGQVGADFQADLLPMDDSTEDRYQKEFYEPLFGRGVELPLTVGAQPPLIYDLSLTGENGEEPHNLTLAFYDTAGENFDDPHSVRHMVRYLRVASGIIFLVDPLQSALVRQSLSSTVRLPQSDMVAESDKVISRVLTELEAGRILTRNGLLTTPVAVAFTKCDVLRDAGLIDGDRLWNSDKRHLGCFDQEAHNDMAGMMAECAKQWSPKTYSTVKARFSHCAFFGVSSTGCAPDRQTHQYKYISPWRVEDPLLWLLAELGVISTVPAPDPARFQ